MASQEVLTALDSLHRELEKLEPAIKHVELAQMVTKMVESIPQKHVDLLKELKDNDVRYKGELKDLFSKELTSITEENEKLATTTIEIQKQVKSELEALTSLRETVQAFHERVEKINFPSRLDKLDANIAGIMVAVQSIQSRLDGLERNITDRLKDISENQKVTRTDLQSSIEQVKSALQKTLEEGTKKQQANTYFTWALIVIGAVAMFIISKL